MGSVHLVILRKQGLRGHTHPVFTAALLTAAGTWKPPKRPPTGEWIKKMRDIYTGQCHSAVRRNERMPTQQRAWPWGLSYRTTEVRQGGRGTF